MKSDDIKAKSLPVCKDLIEFSEIALNTKSDEDLCAYVLDKNDIYYWLNIESIWGKVGFVWTNINNGVGKFSEKMSIIPPVPDGHRVTQIAFASADDVIMFEKKLINLTRVEAGYLKSLIADFTNSSINYFIFPNDFSKIKVNLENCKTFTSPKLILNEEYNNFNIPLFIEANTKSHMYYARFKSENELDTRKIFKYNNKCLCNYYDVQATAEKEKYIQFTSEIGIYNIKHFYNSDYTIPYIIVDDSKKEKLVTVDLTDCECIKPIHLYYPHTGFYKFNYIGDFSKLKSVSFFKAHERFDYAVDPYELLPNEFLNKLDFPINGQNDASGVFYYCVFYEKPKVLPHEFSEGLLYKQCHFEFDTEYIEFYKNGSMRSEFIALNWINLTENFYDHLYFNAQNISHYSKASVRLDTMLIRNNKNITINKVDTYLYVDRVSSLKITYCDKEIYVEEYSTIELIKNENYYAKVILSRAKTDYNNGIIINFDDREYLKNSIIYIPCGPNGGYRNKTVISNYTDRILTISNYGRIDDLYFIYAGNVDFKNLNLSVQPENFKDKLISAIEPYDGDKIYTITLKSDLYNLLTEEEKDYIINTCNYTLIEFIQ